MNCIRNMSKEGMRMIIITLLLILTMVMVSVDRRYPAFMLMAFACMGFLYCMVYVIITTYRHMHSKRNAMSNVVYMDQYRENGLGMDNTTPMYDWKKES